MTTADPYRDLLETIAESISKELARSLGVNIPSELIMRAIEEPPLRKFGDLGIPVPRLSKELELEFQEVAELVEAGLRNIDVVHKVARIGPYVDAFIDMEKYASKILESLKELSESYGVPRVERPQKIVVEYVSANPVHPLHIGSGRNAAIGDFIYRILSMAGHNVERRYYIDDMGLQVAYLAYGYLKLGRPNPPEGMKPDKYYGLIYAATATVVDLLEVKRRVEALREKGGQEYSDALRELDSLMSDLAKIREKIPKEVDRLIEEIPKDEDPKASIGALMRGYEFGNKEARVMREVSEKVMEGIKRTLARLGINMDVWDWESDLVREGLVQKVLEEAKKSPHFIIHRGVPALDFKELLKDEDLRRRLRIPEGLEIPPLILVRSDGTTLYTTRDIAYTLKKFKEAQARKVYNVIAIEQTLPQAQLRLALYALGYKFEAENTIHYSYEMVNLVGASMAGRRGRYVTVDDLLDQMKERILNIMSERGSRNEDVAERMARSAFRYMMLSTSPNKTLVFDVNKALNIRQASGPYIQYTYARAKAVLTKAGGVPWDRLEFKGAGEGLRRELLWLLGKFPHVMKEVLESLRPEDLVTYINKVADTFNTWYDAEPIAKEPDEGLRALKLAITYGVSVVLASSMKALGMDVLERV